MKLKQQTDPQVLADAEAALERYIAGQRKRGALVELQRPLYHEGLANARCVLAGDGESARMYFRKSLGRWVKAHST